MLTDCNGDPRFWWDAPDEYFLLSIPPVTDRPTHRNVFAIGDALDGYIAFSTSSEIASRITEALNNGAITLPDD